MDQSEKIKKSIGIVLLRRRKGCALTQLELSDKSGVARSYIPQLEQGDKMPSIEVLMRFASAFDLLPSTLVREIEEECRKQGICFPLEW